MRIVVVAVGRLKAGPERQLVERYLGRFDAMARGLGLGAIDVRELDESRARRADGRMAEEAQAIRERVVPGARLVVLDERARAIDSAAFAADIGRARDAATPQYCVVVGGPDGLDRALVGQADLAIAFGAMTWPHQLVRVMLAEQLYRAATILAGHPYHRG